jgi:hypothetical protein
MNNIEKQAAEVLLDRGVRWKVPAPWYLRLIGKKTVSLGVTSLKLGTLLELSRLYIEMDLTSEQMKGDTHKIIQDHLKTVCRITAMCILNSKIKIRLFTKPLARYILWAFTANMQLEVILFITNYSGTESFLTTIGFIRDLKITSPKNPSPEIQGS